jgi:hypothetical protein
MLSDEEQLQIKTANLNRVELDKLVDANRTPPSLEQVRIKSSAQSETGSIHQ